MQPNTSSILKDYMVHIFQPILSFFGLLVMNPQLLYEKLYAHYGSQYWWPGEGFEIGIGAILTQNTNWRNVEKALANLKDHDLLEPAAILLCDTKLLSSLIEPAGFSHQKAEYLRNFCTLWLENPSPARDELLAVKGIGAETADCILLYLLETPEFVIDAYTVRISTRLGFGTSTKKQFWKDYYEASLEKDVSLFKEFHALFVVHAKEYCKKTRPICQTCFLQSDCKNKIIDGK